MVDLSSGPRPRGGGAEPAEEVFPLRGRGLRGAVLSRKFSKNFVGSRDSFKHSLKTFLLSAYTRLYSALELFGRCALQIYLLTYLLTYFTSDWS